MITKQEVFIIEDVEAGGYSYGFYVADVNTGQTVAWGPTSDETFTSFSEALNWCETNGLTIVEEVE